MYFLWIETYGKGVLSDQAEEEWQFKKAEKGTI